MPQSNDRNTVRHITCESLTKPLPIYSHATVHNGIVHVSCIQGFIPGTLDFPSKEPADQAKQVLHNLKIVLQEAGSDLTHVLKLTIFMTDMDGFDKINEAINEAFPSAAPARSSIAVPALPKGAKVVMEAIAAVIED